MITGVIVNTMLILVNKFVGYFGGNMQQNSELVDHEQHIRASSGRSRLESKLETPNFDPPPVEPKPAGGRAENW